MNSPKHVPGFLTAAEVARLAGVHPWTVRRWERAGKLTPVPIPGQKKPRYREHQAARLAAWWRATVAAIESAPIPPKDKKGDARAREVAARYAAMKRHAKTPDLS